MTELETRGVIPLNHTPGPWHRNIPPATHYPTVWAGRNKHVCKLSDRGPKGDEAEANINLISAAPELLDALINVQEWIKGKGVELDFEKIDHAISRAKGETL
jgi:hypothetical protein